MSDHEPNDMMAAMAPNERVLHEAVRAFQQAKTGREVDDFTVAKFVLYSPLYLPLLDAMAAVAPEFVTSLPASLRVQITRDPPPDVERALILAAHRDAVRAALALFPPEP